jgi:hypothetical protein
MPKPKSRPRRPEPAGGADDAGFWGGWESLSAEERARLAAQRQARWLGESLRAQKAYDETLRAELGTEGIEIETKSCEAGEEQCVHGPGFRSVRWYGVEYSFTGTQAEMVALLWHAWQRNVPDVAERLLLEKGGVAATSRLIDTFRGHPAWGTMIVSGGSRGAYRLTEPRTS